jgi:hypothetical protein
MNAKTPEKREIKGYRVVPSKYAKAMKRAKKEKFQLAILIEEWVALYADGYTIGIIEQAP